MIIENELAATTYRVLNKFACEIMSSSSWNWQCVVKNGTRLPLSASFDEGFLHLACRPDACRKTALALEDAMLCNKSLSGGVKLAHDPFETGLHLRTDIVVQDELQLRDRLEWALDGFHDGNLLLKSHASLNNFRISQAVPVPDADLTELLRDCSWPCAERGQNDFSANLDATGAPTGKHPDDWKLSCAKRGIASLQCNGGYNSTGVGNLSSHGSCSLRMVRAYAEHADEQVCYGFHVCLHPLRSWRKFIIRCCPLRCFSGVCARNICAATQRGGLAIHGCSQSFNH